MKTIAPVTLSCFAFCLFFLGCSGDSGNDGSGDFVNDASTTRGDGGKDVVVEGRRPPPNDATDTPDVIVVHDATPPVYGCSADLKYVIDGNGTIIETCAPALGCMGGKCVPPCEAAANSKGNVGCDFVVATPSFYPTINQPCFAVFLANNWPGPVKIQVHMNATSYDVTKFGRIPTTDPNATNWPTVPETGLPPDQVAVLFLSSHPNSYNGANNPLMCPVAPAINDATAVVATDKKAATGKGSAWHITTDMPVSAYDIHPYGGAKSFLPSAELLLPTTAWGTNYIAVVPKLEGGGGPQYGSVVASQDDTTVTLLSNVPLPAGAGVTAIPANTPTEIKLQRNEFVQWQPTGEMSGTIISADKPIAFTGGTGYLCLSSSTSSGGGCDSGHQAIPPVSAFGYRYVGMPFSSRMASNSPESIPYRIVGAVEGTTLTFDPPVPGAPSTLTVGQMVNFEAVGAFVVSSQDANHPFYLGQMMPGCHVHGGSTSPGGCLGDEEFVNILPPAQFLSRYVFFTDPTYPTTNLVLTRVKTAEGFHDVSLGCSGVVSGWQPVGTSGEFEITNVDLIRGRVGVGGCTNGPQLASSNGPFGVMVWGLDHFASYAYPAGGNVAPINTVVVPPVPK